MSYQYDTLNKMKRISSQVLWMAIILITLSAITSMVIFKHLARRPQSLPAQQPAQISSGMQSETSDALSQNEARRLIETCEATGIERLHNGQVFLYLRGQAKQEVSSAEPQELEELGTRKQDECGRQFLNAIE